jgi:hypothetical protein
MSKYYGTGSGREVVNPWYPDEESWEGPSKTIVSPVASAFDAIGGIAKSNTFDDRLSNTGAIPGHATKSENGSRRIGERKGRK